MHLLYIQRHVQGEYHITFSAVVRLYTNFNSTALLMWQHKVYSNTFIRIAVVFASYLWILLTFSFVFYLK